MVLNKTVIHFTAYCEGERYDLQTYKGEYRNLMMLLYDKIYIEGFGECKGMGRCGTCIVKVEGLPPAVSSYERNEESTLYKTGMLAAGFRLACQLLVDENLANTVVHITGGEQ